MDRHSIFRLSIVLLMVAAFLYQMWELFGQFLSGLTTVAISIEEKEEYELPSFAFCDTRAFTRSVSMEEIFTNYNDTTFDMDEKVEFLGIHKTDGMKFNNFEINHTTEVVPTFFNGYCKLYEFQQSHQVNTYIEFNLPENMSFDIFLLEKGSKLSLITQEFVLRPQPSFTITHTTQLFISLTITKISDDNCQKITTSQQMECYINKLRMRIIEEEDISCLPPQIYNIFYESDLDLPLCQNNTNSAMSAYMTTLAVIEQPQDTGCPQMCENMKFQITNPKLGQNLRWKANKTVLLAKMNSPWVTIEEEYRLMGVNAIISATGGSLGLFLGLSCYGVVWKLCEWLEAAYKLLRLKIANKKIYQ